MSEQTAHTPTPWDREIVEVIWLGGLNALLDSGKAGVAETLLAAVDGTAKKDAAFVWAAVNSHAQLVRYLEEISRHANAARIGEEDMALALIKAALKDALRAAGEEGKS